jgi:hypothetical protein
MISRRLEQPMEVAMCGRIRGHYRIDSSGRVEPMTDVNSAARAYTIPRAVLANRPENVRRRLKRMSVAGMSFFFLGVGLLVAMPWIELAFLSAQSAHLASVRASYIQNHPGLKVALDERR